MGLYLDYNASAPMLEGSMDAIIKAMQLIGNPSSIHTSGRDLSAKYNIYIWGLRIKCFSI